MNLRTTLWSLILLFIGWNAFSQAPQAVCYQAVVTDDQGTELVQELVNLRVSILKDSPAGLAEWVESHSPFTDDFGLFNIEIGTGTHLGGQSLNFLEIPWGNHTFFLKVEMNLGGSNYKVLGINQILSVPYALYAETAGTVLSANHSLTSDHAIVADSALNDNDTELGNEFQFLSFDSTSSILSISDGNAVLIPMGMGDNDPDPNNERQTLTRSGNELSLSMGGGTVNIDDADSDATNEIQTLNFDPVTNQLSLSPGNSTINIPVNGADADPNPTNELQILNYENDTLSISNGNGIFFSKDDADADPKNELQSLDLIGNALIISDFPGGGVDLSNLNLPVDDADADPSNEFQDIDLNGNVLTLTDAPGAGVDLSNLNIPVDDADADPSNEFQDIDLNGNVLTLTDAPGAGVDLSNLNIPIDDADADPSNEFQDIDLNGNVLTLTDAPGAGVDLSNLNIPIDDADSDPNNEIQDIHLNGTILSLTNSTNPGVDLSNLNIPVNDADADPFNEIQTISQNGDTISISGGNEIVLNDNDPDNEIQELIYTADTIGLTGGNFINLDNLIFGHPGASIDYPQGIRGEHILITDPVYTVPAGKYLYLTAGPPKMNLVIPSGEYEHTTAPNMPLLKENVSIKNCNCLGILLKAIPTIDPIIIDLENNPNYTVPSGKVLVVKSGLVSDNTSFLEINGFPIEFFRPNFLRSSKILTFPEGTTIAKPSFVSDTMILTGFLFEE